MHILLFYPLWTFSLLCPRSSFLYFVSALLAVLFFLLFHVFFFYLCIFFYSGISHTSYKLKPVNLWEGKGPLPHFSLGLGFELASWPFSMSLQLSAVHCQVSFSILSVFFFPGVPVECYFRDIILRFSQGVSPAICHALVML